jgi:hypothetical protein
VIERQVPTCEITARASVDATRRDEYFMQTAADGSYSMPVAAGRYTISLEDCAMCSGNATAHDVELGGGDSIQLGLDCQQYGK